ncbi:hypothetical protein K493DRAFT_387194 [Basidiobolus meristosporus CBS 931.73]|uniref:Uncharacterized protein n=1 Tax=Basidiobolus meristosporus CBS 931.73 TaxID=1314790 RepID=A0A1Y1XHQ7_9FUNG|nr:hypothetical protein K493DRAFT_387194 [Basidiobolus meristosporus CBS 931.73]|eukprot:ORX84914.1 hypothetical protein K493DRAFT_387194 [Basidiobolus meristosporus CBS 931.73]
MLGIQLHVTRILAYMVLICIGTTVAQSTEVPRLNAIAFQDGRTIWTFSRFKNYSSFVNANPQSPTYIQDLKASILPDLVVAYDKNRNLLFQRDDFPPLWSDDHSLFVALPSGDIGYFYIELGSNLLNLQVYSADGKKKGDNIALQDVITYSAAVSLAAPMRILLAFIDIDPNSGPSLKMQLFDTEGIPVGKPSLLASNIFDASQKTLYQPSVSVSATADGSFLVSWPGKTRAGDNVIRAAYVAPNQPVTKAFIVSTSTANTGFMKINKCDTLRAGDGHYCIYEEWAPQGGTVWTRITFITVFSYSGSVYDTPTRLGNSTEDVSKVFSPAMNIALPYGGLLVTTDYKVDPTNPSAMPAIFLYDREWNPKPYDGKNIKSYTVCVLPNNTVVTLEQVKQPSAEISSGEWLIQPGWRAVKEDLPKFLPDSKYGDNPVISSTYPELYGMIPLGLGYLNISFLQEDYRFGLGNLSIYDSHYPEYPREVISVIPDPNGLGKSLSMKVSSFTFNTPSHDYFVTIDGGAFKSSLNEPLLGIPKNTWSFTTAAAEKDDVILQIRVKYSKGEFRDRSEVAQKLTQDLSQLVPVEKERVMVRYLRSDEVGEIYQVSLMRLRNGNGKRMANKLADDLHAMILRKTSSNLVAGNATKFVDPEFGTLYEGMLDLITRLIPHGSNTYISLGCLENIFQTNKGALIAIACVVIGLIAFYIFCHRRFPESDNMVIFVLAVSLFDFVADLLFVILNSGDIPYLQIPSVIFFVLPFSFNMIASTTIVVKEVSTNPKFHDWFSKKTLLTTGISVLSATNPVLLNIMRSRFAGMNELNAPLSERVSRWILYCTAADIIIEDIPQLVIQTLYKTNNGFFKLIPFLAMVSSCLGILFSIIAHIYNHVAYKQGKKKSRKEKSPKEFHEIEYKTAKEFM